MCGIVGYSSAARYDYALRSAMDIMHYRGPDSEGERIIETDGRYIGVGHVRLKVLDLDNRSSQPFVTKSGNSLIVFNGEIYNFLSLRNMLPKHAWNTASDTEVIAELLESFGDSVVAKFNGIYAIARICLLTGKLTLFRDPLGIKPLYYSSCNGDVFFASEIKALSYFPVDLEISTCDLLESLNFGYVHEPNTGFKEVKKIPPGSMIIFHKGAVHEQRFNYQPEMSKFSELNLKSALKRQTISDVPIGTFFSGGADSSVMASQVEGDLLYINGRMGEDGGSEKNHVEKLASVFERKLLISNLPAEDNFGKIIETIDDVVNGVEEPISDLTYVVSKDLAMLAKQKGFTVMLSGMGADELFGGYLRYYIVKYKWIFNPAFRLFLFLNSYRKIAGKHKLDRIRNYLSETNPLKKYARLVGYFSDEEIKGCMGNESYQQSDLKVFNRLRESIPNKLRNNEFLSIRFLEMKGFLSHNLTVADKSSMSSSVELRVPFLDLELVSSWFGVNYDKPGVRSLGKKPLLKLLRKYVSFKWSPFSKTGFNPPIAEFFKRMDRASVEEVIFSKDMLIFFNREGLEAVVDDCFSSEHINFHKIWQLLFLSRWLYQWNNSGEKINFSENSLGLRTKTGI